MSGERYVIGVDFGTLSGRAVVVRAADGRAAGRGGVPARRDERPARRRRAAPALGAPGSRRLRRGAAQCGAGRRRCGPASIPPASSRSARTSPPARCCPCCADGTPLSRVPDGARTPTPGSSCGSTTLPSRHADRINALAAQRGEPWLARYGGRISSEWEFAKALQLLEEDPDVYAAMDRFVEAADWIVWQLSGSRLRNACTAGYKGIYQDGHYPDPELPRGAESCLRALRGREACARKIAQLGDAAGALTAQAAEWTGLPAGIPVAVGNVDAHVTAPAAQAVEARADAGDHGHVDMPRDERGRTGRSAWHVWGRRRRHRARAVRVRGGPVRCRGHLRLVRRQLRTSWLTNRMPNGRG